MSGDLISPTGLDHTLTARYCIPFPTSPSALLTHLRKPHDDRPCLVMDLRRCLRIVRIEIAWIGLEGWRLDSIGEFVVIPLFGLPC